MVDITLFEIHLEDATFDADAVANAPLSGLFGDDEAAAASEGDGSDDADAGGRERGRCGPLGKLLGALLVAALVGGLAWLVFGDDAAA